MNLSANLSRSTPIVDTRALRGVQLLLLAGLLLEPSIARAQFRGGMPWEGPIQQLVASLTGPVAKGVGIVAIVGLGLPSPSPKEAPQCARPSGS